MAETEVKRNKKIWVFNAGDAFSGNPKWLFLYIVNHRKDITPYWLCYKENMVSYMKERGYKAYLFNSPEGKAIERQAGIYVVNQVKEVSRKNKSLSLILLLTMAIYFFIDIQFL